MTAGATSDGETRPVLPRVVRRYHPYLVLLVAVTLIVFVPTSDDGRVGTAGSAGTRSAGAASGDGTALQTAPDAAARATTVAGAPGVGGTATPTNGSPARAGATPAAAGIGTPEALAAPDCDRGTGRLRIEFLWAVGGRDLWVWRVPHGHGTTHP